MKPQAEIACKFIIPKTPQAPITAAEFHFEIKLKLAFSSKHDAQNDQRHEMIDFEDGFQTPSPKQIIWEINKKAPGLATFSSRAWANDSNEERKRCEQIQQIFANFNLNINAALKTAADMRQ